MESGVPRKNFGDSLREFASHSQRWVDKRYARFPKYSAARLNFDTPYLRRISRAASSWNCKYLRIQQIHSGSVTVGSNQGCTPTFPRILSADVIRAYTNNTSHCLLGKQSWLISVYSFICNQLCDACCKWRIIDIRLFRPHTRVKIL